MHKAQICADHTRAVEATDMLREDHRQIRRLREIISRCHAALAAGRDVPLEDMDRIPAIIGGFLDSVHYSREENSYFPCVAGYGGLNEEIRKLLIEHEFSRRIAANMERHLAAWRAGRDSREPVARYMRTYRIYLDDHMAKEEAFFDRAEAESLSPEEERQMYEQFRSGMADIRMSEMLRDMEYLEGCEWCKK